MEQISLREWLKNWEDGKYSNQSPIMSQQVKAACDAGWYDWFCHDRFLFAKTQKLGKIVERIAQSDKIDLDKHYVWFKNNCPMNGSLYDDIRIASLETQNTAYVIVPKSGFKSDKGKAFVYAESAGYGEVFSGKMDDVYAFFGV